ncbi:uncharacterized protein [Henckelia pumila]|uniref:uncharacterized protein n=1 Tax=Henckelia pumila TaxID=405737 RepID=UPI003C6E85E4
MRTAQSRQKSYADHRRRDLEFLVGDHVFIRVAPMKGMMRFGKKGKLAPRFIGPFEILDRIGALAYRVALPPSLDEVHNVFHVSMLRKYISNPSHVLSYEPLQLSPHMTYEERPDRILGRRERRLCKKTIPMVKMAPRCERVLEPPPPPAQDVGTWVLAGLAHILEQHADASRARPGNIYE